MASEQVKEEAAENWQGTALKVVAITPLLIVAVTAVLGLWSLNRQLEDLIAAIEAGPNKAKKVVTWQPCVKADLAERAEISRQPGEAAPGLEALVATRSDRLGPFRCGGARLCC